MLWVMFLIQKQIRVIDIIPKPKLLMLSPGSCIT